MSIIVSEINLRKTSTTESHLYAISRNVKLTNRVKWWLSGTGKLGKRRDVGQSVQTLSCKMNRVWDLMYNLMTIVNNNVLRYLKFAKRVDLKCSHHTYTQKVTNMR